MKYRPEVDGLRAVAVLPVVLFHAGFSLLSGNFAVVNLCERWVRGIFPTLFVAVVCAASLAIWSLLPADREEFGQSMVALSMSHGWVQRYSSADCDMVGVSFIERGDFVHKRFESQHHRPFDPSDALKQLMQQAEVIWLVTSWQPWEVSFLKQSLDALRRDFWGKFVVVGAKSFGDIQPRQLLAGSESARAQHARPVSAAFLANNQAVAQASLGVPFVNKHRLMCGSGSTCATFTQHARLISYDGGHLTQFGADKLGRELSAPAVVQRLLRQAQRPAP
jgi:SGNH domain (fused to AT3 domains)